MRATVRVSAVEPHCLLSDQLDRRGVHAGAPIGVAQRVNDLPHGWREASPGLTTATRIVMLPTQTVNVSSRSHSHDGHCGDVRQGSCTAQVRNRLGPLLKQSRNAGPAPIPTIQTAPDCLRGQPTGGGPGPSTSRRTVKGRNPRPLTLCPGALPCQSPVELQTGPVGARARDQEREWLEGLDSDSSGSPVSVPGIVARPAPPVASFFFLSLCSLLAYHGP